MKLYDEKSPLGPDEYWVVASGYRKVPMLTRERAEAQFYHERGDNVQLVTLQPVKET